LTKNNRQLLPIASPFLTKLSTNQNVKEITVVDDLIERLGGGSILGLAKALGVSRPTIYRWKELGYVPSDSSYEIVARVAKLSGIPEAILTGQLRYVAPKNMDSRTD
jgi:hypothetical protein